MQKRTFLLIAAIAFSMIFAPLAMPNASALDGSVDTIHARGLWTAEWADALGNVHQGVTGKGVGVAIVDSGIDGLHQDLDEGHAIYNAKFIGIPPLLVPDAGTWIETPNSDTSSGHGTHCAGIIGGTGEKSGGIKKGVAWGCNLIGLGCGDLAVSEYYENGFDWIVENAEKYNVKVVSCSFGGPDVDARLQWFYEHGIITVFSAGNGDLVTGEGGDGSEDLTGGGSKNPYTIGVAACEKNGRTLADFSSRGAKSDNSTWPEITAPGVDIDSCAATLGIYVISFPEAAPIVGDGYVSASGTSMSCPHVSGVVALMFEVNPNLAPAQVMEIINKTADQNFGTYEESGFAAGHGLINATKAVAAAHYMILRPSASVATAASSSKVGEKDGHLVLNPGMIYAQNAPPQASFTYNPSSAITTSTTVEFTDASTDADGAIVSWSWSFGDGADSASRNPSHKFSAAGNYTVKLTVQDNEGAYGYYNKTIAVASSQAAGAKVPSRVTGLTVSVSGRKMQLAWEVPGDNGNPITKYRIYKAVNSSEARILLGESNANSYSDSGISAGKKYYYWVSAVNSAGEGALSAYTWVNIPQDYKFEEEEPKSFIPGFEVAALAASIAVVSIAAYKKRR